MITEWINKLDLLPEDITREIVHEIEIKLGIDLGRINDFVLRRRLKLALDKSGTSYSGNSVCIDSRLAAHIVSDCLPDITEVFRDIETWLFIRKLILSNPEQADILIPMATKGEELYSLLILLNELSAVNRFHISVTYPSYISLENITQGILFSPRSRFSFVNFKQICPECDFPKYFLSDNQAIKFRKEFITGINFRKDFKSGNTGQIYDIILCRNKTLALKEPYSTGFFKAVSDVLKPEGYLFIGTHEQLTGEISAKYKPVSKQNGIFKKIAQ